MYAHKLEHEFTAGADADMVDSWVSSLNYEYMDPDYRTAIQVISVFHV